MGLPIGSMSMPNASPVRHHPRPDISPMSGSETHRRHHRSERGDTGGVPWGQVSVD